MNFKIKPLAAGLAMAGMLSAGSAVAETLTVDALVQFVTPITLTQVQELDFGQLNSDIGDTEVVAIDADGTITDASSNIAGGTLLPAEVLVTSAGTGTLTVEVDAITNGSGYDLTAFNCEYDGGAQADCDLGDAYTTSVAGGGSASLMIGATLTANATAKLATDNSTFDVTVLYQ